MDKFEKKINEAILVEETAVQVYMYDLQSALGLLNIPETKRVIIREKIKVLADDSKRHAKMLKTVRSMHLT